MNEENGLSVSVPLLAVVSSCAFATFFILSPGMMSYDSLVTWRMSMGAVGYSDAHPMAFTILLHALRVLWDNPSVFLVFNLLIWACGTAFLAEYARRRVKILGYLIPFTIFAPFVMNFIGAHWKDTTLAVCWWASVSIAIFATDLGARKQLSRNLLMSAAYVLLVLGLIIRHNAISAAPFILCGLVAAHIGFPDGIWRRLSFVAASIAVCASAIIGSNYIFRAIYPITRSDMFASVMVHDLAGITVRSNNNSFPVHFSPEEIVNINKCYKLTDWNSYADRSQCLFVYAKLQSEGWINHAKLKFHWVASIIRHPISYSKHRFAVFASFARLGYPEPYYIVHPGIDENDMGLHWPDSAIKRRFFEYIEYFKMYPFMKPWFWLSYLFALSVAWVATGGWRKCPLGAFCTISGVSYIMAYLPLGIASDFRYAYWSIFAALFGTVTFISWVAESRHQKFADDGSPVMAVAK